MTKDQTVTNRRLERMTHAVNHRLLGLTIVAEGTHLRHNLSAMIRSAESFGVTAIAPLAGESNPPLDLENLSAMVIPLMVHQNRFHYYHLSHSFSFLTLLLYPR